MRLARRGVLLWAHRPTTPSFSAHQYGVKRGYQAQATQQEESKKKENKEDLIKLQQLEREKDDELLQKLTPSNVNTSSAEDFIKNASSNMFTQLGTISGEGAPVPEEEIDIEEYIERARMEVEGHSKGIEPDFRTGVALRLKSVNDILNEPRITPQQAEQVLSLAKQVNVVAPIFYSQVTHVFAREGDIAGVMKIVERTIQDGYPVDSEIYTDVKYVYYLNKKFADVLAKYDEMMHEGYRPTHAGYIMAVGAAKHLNQPAKEVEIKTQMAIDGFGLPEKFMDEQ